MKPCWYRGWIRAVTSGALKQVMKTKPWPKFCFMCLNWGYHVIFCLICAVPRKQDKKINVCRNQVSSQGNLMVIIYVEYRVNTLFCPGKSDWILAAGFSSYPEQWGFFDKDVVILGGLSLTFTSAVFCLIFCYIRRKMEIISWYVWIICK